MKVFFLSILLSPPVLAHDARDWRFDTEAFLSVEVAPVIPSHSLRVSERIDMGFFKAKLIAFAAKERKSNAGLDSARAMLTEEYRKIGFEVSLHPFGSGTNFIAEKKGTLQAEKVLILSSHIDSVGNKGANDDGTGTIGVLAIARELSKKDYPFTVRILGFDREEQGLIGSDAYVATIADKKNIIGDIHFEMMGYHARNDGGFHLIDCDKPFLWNVGRGFSEFLSTEVKNSISGLGLDLTVVKTCTSRSDHASFWRHKIPAIVISENFFGGDGDPCYHAKCDVVDERLNYDYISKILEATLDASSKILSKL